MDISGVRVRTYPGDIDAVTQALSCLQGVEVHGANQDGRMVVTIEGGDAGQAADLLVQMRNVPGVLSASLVYHQFEDSGQQEA
jgi:nitrate reductase NapD